MPALTTFLLWATRLRYTGAIWIALALSFCGNVYLLVHRRHASSVAKPTSPVADRDSHEPMGGPTIIPDVSIPSCADRGLQQRLLETQSEIERYLPLDERWERTARSPDNEVRIAKRLDILFAEAGGTSYDVECHGPICKVESEESSQSWLDGLPEEDGAHAIGLVQVGVDGIFLELKDQ